jgi:hypothetical protein
MRGCGNHCCVKKCAFLGYANATTRPGEPSLQAIKIRPLYGEWTILHPGGHASTPEVAQSQVTWSKRPSQSLARLQELRPASGLGSAFHRRPTFRWRSRDDVDVDVLTSKCSMICRFAVFAAWPISSVEYLVRGNRTSFVKHRQSTTVRQARRQHASSRSRFSGDDDDYRNRSTKARIRSL